MRFTFASMLLFAALMLNILASPSYMRHGGLLSRQSTSGECASQCSSSSDQQLATAIGNCNTNACICTDLSQMSPGCQTCLIDNDTNGSLTSICATSPAPTKNGAMTNAVVVEGAALGLITVLAGAMFLA